MIACQRVEATLLPATSAPPWIATAQEVTREATRAAAARPQAGGGLPPGTGGREVTHPTEPPRADTIVPDGAAPTSGAPAVRRSSPTLGVTAPAVLR
jgi:hypothetical protein